MLKKADVTGLENGYTTAIEMHDQDGVRGCRPNIAVERPTTAIEMHDQDGVRGLALLAVRCSSLLVAVRCSLLTPDVPRDFVVLLALNFVTVTEGADIQNNTEQSERPPPIITIIPSPEASGRARETQRRQADWGSTGSD